MVCGSARGPEVDIRCFPLSHSTLLLETGSFPKPEACFMATSLKLAFDYTGPPESPQDLSVSALSSMGFKGPGCCAWLLHGSGNLNLSHRACAASSSLTGSPPQSSLCVCVLIDFVN